MMSRNPNSDDRQLRQGRKIIMKSKEEAYKARRALRREMPQPSQETRGELAAALADYYDVLSDYRNESALEEPWDERFPGQIDSLLEETVTVERSVPGRNQHAREEVEVPRALQLSTTRLIEIAKELDDVAKELGFAAPAREPTPTTEASHSDLRELLKSRGQTDALDHLPDDTDE
jgi:hypothetical protein